MSNVRASSEAISDPDVQSLLPMPAGTVPELRKALGLLLEDISRFLGVPIALLSREGASWRFEADVVPDLSGIRSMRFVEQARPDGSVEESDASRGSWTGLFAGTARQREWLLMVPGRTEQWRDTPGLQDVVDRFGRDLEAAVNLDDERRVSKLHRRLYAFVLRLNRTSDCARTQAYILQTIARQVGAKTGALAIFSEVEQALTITETLGYPRSIVDHVRIVSGEGVIGQTFETGRAVIGHQTPDCRRMRYETDSYIALPLRVSGNTIAVVTLTDRRDGRAFEDRDLAGARLLAAPAALALARQRVNQSLDELTRAATVDAVTGLFNRRYFETRIQAEVQRARRQQQDLALLMVDIDDFKRINDTFGHLEGDRALRDVADLLRRGVRIFDVCARYGGEEFAIVMPGATRDMAVQVAERIRQGMHERSRMTPLPMTVSIGVGFLGADQSQEDLIAAADRALFAAKRAGKNVVKTA